MISINFTAPVVLLLPQGFPRGRWAARGIDLVGRSLRPFIFPLPSKCEQPSCQYDYPARCTWLTWASQHNGPESVNPGPSMPLALRHVGPDSKCHVTSPHSIKAPLRTENTNRWLNCLQTDSPRQPRRGRALSVAMGCSICSAKSAEGKSGPCTHRACRMLAWMLGISCLLRMPFAFAKYPLNPWSLAWVPWYLMVLKCGGGKLLFIFITSLKSKCVEKDAPSHSPAPPQCGCWAFCFRNSKPGFVNPYKIHGLGCVQGIISVVRFMMKNLWTFQKSLMNLTCKVCVCVHIWFISKKGLNFGSDSQDDPL